MAVSKWSNSPSPTPEEFFIQRWRVGCLPDCAADCPDESGEGGRGGKVGGGELREQTQSEKESLRAAIVARETEAVE